MKSRSPVVFGFLVCVVIGLAVYAVSPDARSRWQVFRYGIGAGAASWGDPHLERSPAAGKGRKPGNLSSDARAFSAGYTLGQHPWAFGSAGLGIVAVGVGVWAVRRGQKRRTAALSS